MSQEQTPKNVVVLDNVNSLQILAQFVELAQSKGAYLLTEADLLKRATDILINNVADNEINTDTAKNIMIQGIHKGQRHGAYTLHEAAMLCKVVQFVADGGVQQPPQQPSQVTSQEDLSDLAEPIPLKPKEV